MYVPPLVIHLMLIDKIKLFSLSLKDKKFFPTQKTNAFKKLIQNFLQNSNEPFFNVGNQFVETICDEEFLHKEVEEAFDYLDYLVENS
ncbi:hypothetical protein CXB51_028032 [Gossypium anomalum]|uniref:Uncharacterized protein n=1 Tax=Gossypium anomalum TaxID=47600 RepID=A0A8J5Y6P2_9ROSI|nr:hypothetical protein CXB51_028032 [Gossypium anomalum]